MFSPRQILFAILCAMASTAVCAAQNPVSFKEVTSINGGRSTLGTPANIYAADLNNDGIADIIQDVGDSSDNFAVSIAKGDGTFKAPVYYSYPAGTYRPRAALAFGDFNGDGNIDLIAAIIGTNSLAVYLGNGDGTFQEPKTYTLSLSGVYKIAFCPLVAADFNHDGKLDLILSGEVTGLGTVARLFVLAGNGDGTFATAQTIYAPGVPESAFVQLVTGDFDGDGNADIGIGEIYSPDNIHSFNEILVLYGDGHLGFGNPGIVSVLPWSFEVGLILAAGDLNRDGLTDLIAIEPGKTPPFFITAFGHTRATTWPENTFVTQIPYTNYGTGSGLAPQIAVADFNDDGYVDFAIPASLHGANYWVFFLSRGGVGQFTTRTWNLPSFANLSNPVVGNFNRDGKPDLAIVGYDCDNLTCTPSTEVIDSVIITELNFAAHGVWSNCTYPLEGRGITLCAPVPSTSNISGEFTFNSSPVNFNATANSFGQLRKMELWVDGNQLSQQSNVWENHAFLGFNAALTPGVHQGKILASDVDSTEQQLDFNFTVGTPTCIPPPADGVKICSLSSDGVYTASAKVSGTLARMELWVDGTKEYTVRTSNYLAARVALTPGKHKITVVAANTDGKIWAQSVNQVLP